MNLNTIRNIKSIKLLEQKFKEHEIKSKNERINLIMAAMGSPAVNFRSANIKLAEKYRTLLDIFASGVWKRNYVSIDKERFRIPYE